jgi:hypothetical protein
MFGIAYTVDALIGDDQTPVPVLVGIVRRECPALKSGRHRICHILGSGERMQPMCQLPHDHESHHGGYVSQRAGSEQAVLWCGARDEWLATCADFTGKGEVFGCAKNASIGIGGLNLTEFPVVGVVTIDEDTASLGDVYS